MPPTNNTVFTMPARAVQARSHDVDPHTSGDGLEAWGGIISAHLDDWAKELNCTPNAVLDAVETAGIEPVVDTAEPKGQGKDRARPTDPALRSLALTRDDAKRLRSVCDKADPESSAGGSTECTVALTTQDREKAMNGTKSEDLRVRVTPSTYEKVEAAAKRENSTVSGWVRERMRKAATETLGASDDPGLSDRAE